MRAMFDEALSKFLNQERANILNGVSERNLCARFGMILESLTNKYGLDGYFADAEYNRKQEGKIKTILDGDMKAVSITCDLILHSRGASIKRDNIIAVEMKKAGRPAAEKVKDTNRLRALTKASYDDVWSNDGTAHPEHVCGYELGIYVEIDPVQQRVTIESFESGKSVDVRHLRF